MATFEEAHAHVALAPPSAASSPPRWPLGADSSRRGRRGRRGRGARSHRRPAVRGSTGSYPSVSTSAGPACGERRSSWPRRASTPSSWPRARASTTSRGATVGPERALLRHGAHPRGRSRLGHPRLREGARPGADPDRHRRARLGGARVALRPRGLHPAGPQGRGRADRDRGDDALRLRGRASARPPPPRRWRAPRR